MSQRNYTNFAKTAAPSSSIASGDTSIDVDTQTDYPDAPYIITVFEGGETPPAASTKEVMRVTAVSGSGPYTLTVERDIDGYNGGGQSFTTSATVQHVSIADEVGPRRAVVAGRTESEYRSRCHADFSVPDQSADGFTIASGQSLSVQSGSASIEDNALFLGGASTNRVLIPNPYSYGGVIYLQNIYDPNSGTKLKIYPEWIDSNNHVYFLKGKYNDIKIAQTVSGSTTILQGGQEHRDGARLVGQFQIHFNWAMVNATMTGLVYGRYATRDEGLDTATFKFDGSNPWAIESSGPMYVPSFSVIGASGNEPSI